MAISAFSGLVLLALFMGSILVVWAVELMDHAGILPGHRVGLRYR